MFVKVKAQILPNIFCYFRLASCLLLICDLLFISTQLSFSQSSLFLVLYRINPASSDSPSHLQEVFICEACFTLLSYLTSSFKHCASPFQTTWVLRAFTNALSQCALPTALWQEIKTTQNERRKWSMFLIIQLWTALAQNGAMICIKMGTKLLWPNKSN